MRPLSEALINKRNMTNVSIDPPRTIREILRNESKYKNNYFIIPSSIAKTSDDVDVLKNEVELIRSIYSHKEDAFMAFHDTRKTVYLLDYKLFFSFDEKT